MIDEAELRANIGKILSFEYKSSDLGWNYEEDVITEKLIKASVNLQFRNMKII